MSTFGCTKRGHRCCGAFANWTQEFKVFQIAPIVGITALFQGDLLQLPQHTLRRLPLTRRQHLEVGQ
jgi:hypothetical protein